MTKNVLRCVTMGLGVVTLALGGMNTAHAQDDFTYGGAARAFAMGGAGLALMPEVGGVRANPASLAFEKRDINLIWPSLGYRALGGVSLNNAAEYLLTGQDLPQAADLARRFAKKDSEFGINANAGIRLGKFEVTGYAVGTGRLQPNDSLRNWANTNGNYNELPADGRADILAAGYYSLPSIAGALTLPAKKDSQHNYAVGLRVKYINAMYTHYIADQQALQGSADVLFAPEMGGKETLWKKGVGADLGFMMRPRKGDGISAALMIANALKPNIKFSGTDRNGLPKRYDLLVTTLSAGAGFQKRGTTLAADLVDLTGAGGDAQFRAGAEQKIVKGFALRGGYSSGGGFTYGGSLFGFDVALGKAQPLEVVRTINF
jgi:hypothetical protein